MPKVILRGEITLRDYLGCDKEIFLDSGAHTAFHQDVEIDINKYIDFIKTQKVDVYANLDVIGSHEGTAQNQKTMEVAGLNPLPVWHLSEPFSVLKQLANSYPYVGIGVSQSKSSEIRANTASSIFEYFPNTKFHMFAVTQPKTLAAYPFYSADSTTWLNSGKYGALITTDGYLMIGRENTDSDRHYSKMSRADQIAWQTYFKLQGLDIKDLLDNYESRLSASAKYFLALEAAINSFETPIKTKKLLDSFFTVQQVRKVVQCLKKKLWDI
jgi:hypothetical protein